MKTNNKKSGFELSLREALKFAQGKKAKVKVETLRVRLTNKNAKKLAGFVVKVKTHPEASALLAKLKSKVGIIKAGSRKGIGFFIRELVEVL